MNPNPAESTEDRDALQQEVSALRNDLTFFLCVQLVFALAVGGFVWRAAVVQHRGLESARLGSGRIHNDQIRQRQIVDEFRKFGATRPEFAQLLRAKGIEVATNAAGGTLPRPRPDAGR